MGIARGSHDFKGVGEIMFGNKNVSEVYKGNIKIWPLWERITDSKYIIRDAVWNNTYWLLAGRKVLDNPGAVLLRLENGIYTEIKHWPEDYHSFRIIKNETTGTIKVLNQYEGVGGWKIYSTDGFLTTFTLEYNDTIQNIGYIQNWAHNGLSGNSERYIIPLLRSNLGVVKYQGASNWALSGFPQALPGGLYGVAYGENKFIVGGGDGNLLWSTDNLGTSWNQASPPSELTGNESFNSIAFGNNMFLTTYGNGKLLYSNGGVFWHDNNLSDGSIHTNNVHFANGRFWLTGSNGYLASSINGESWDEVNLGQSESSELTRVRGDGSGELLVMTSAGHDIYVKSEP